MSLFAFILLIFFQIKHFVADYLLQNKYMLGKFKSGWDFVPPLLLHAGVHGAFTLSLILLCNWFIAIPTAVIVGLTLFDMVSHFLIDRVKASPKMLGKYKVLGGWSLSSFTTSASEEDKKANKYFWWSLGLDQMCHHLVHYAIIAILIYWVS